jgi:hypothetical protein
MLTDICNFFRVVKAAKVQVRLDQLLSTVPILALDLGVVPQQRLDTTVDSLAVANLKAEQQLTATKGMEAMVKLLLTDNSRKQQW